SAEVGANWLTAAVSPSTLIDGVSMPWVQRIIWGNHVARGADVLAEQRPAWALVIVWGDGFDDDDNIVWGNNDDDDNIVWGNGEDDGDNIGGGNNLVGPQSEDDEKNTDGGIADEDKTEGGNTAERADGPS